MGLYRSCRKLCSGLFHIIIMADSDHLEFFNSQAQPQSEYQPGRQPQPAVQDDQHHDGGFGDFEEPAPQPAAENTGYAIPVVEDQFDQPEEIAPKDEVLENMRREEDLIHEKLIAKAQAESELKQQRKAKAQRELQEFLAQRERQVEELRVKNKGQQAARLNTKEYKTPWEKITDNIAIKQGEYPGTKDVSRMRQAILNKKNDG